MTHRISAISLAIAGLLFSAAAQAAGLDFEPGWERKPTAEEIAELYPETAAALGVQGAAVIRCAITETGELKDCAVEQESPLGFDFGKAALALVPTFRMGAGAKSGRPVGGRVRIPIRFQMADGSAPKPTADAEAYREARLHVEASNAMGPIREYIDRKANEIEFTHTDGAPEMRTAAAEALRKAARSSEAAVLDDYAVSYASVLTQAEIASLRAQAQRPGPKFAQGQGEIARIVWPDATITELSAETQRRAHEIYCRTHVCDTSGDLGLIADLKRSPPAVDFPFLPWARTPPESGVLAETPRLAWSLGLASRVRLTCRLAANDGLQACEVAREAPAGFGAGAAALRLARLYRAPAGLVTKSEMFGKKVAVFIDFASPDLEPPPTPPMKPPPPGSLALARKLVRAMQPATPPAEAEVEAALGDLSEVDSSVRREAVASLMAAGVEVLEERLDAAALRLALLMPQADLEEALAFQSSVGAQGLTRKKEALSAAMTASAWRVQKLIEADARQRLCSQMDCGAQPNAATADPSTAKP